MIAPPEISASLKAAPNHPPSTKGVTRGLRDSRTPAALGPFFWLAARAPGVARAIKPVAIEAVARAARQVASATQANARGLFGRDLAPDEQRRFTRDVIGHFYDFALEVGACSSLSRDQLLARLDGAEGEDQYMQARALKRGAIIVTGHLGSFELGLAALARAEPVVRVVFRRDGVAPFEQSRRRIREKLGIIESPIDEGLTTWLQLRDALARDEVVVMQGDRTMPGQRGVVVPFLHGRLRLPLGPVRLAHVTGSPLIPVFSIRQPSGRIKVVLAQAISPQADEHETLLRLSQALASVIGRYPEQWLAFDRMFEDPMNPEPSA